VPDHVADARQRLHDRHFSNHANGHAPPWFRN
jgi:hypothetical protein